MYKQNFIFDIHVYILILLLNRFFKIKIIILLILSFK